MTKHLDELYDMNQQATKKIEETKDLIVVDQNNTVENAVDSEKMVMDLTEVQQHENDMDKLADTAMKGYEDIVELAANSEPKDTGRLLEVASGMLKNAIDAKNSKSRARLKAAELLVKKKLIDSKIDEPDDGELIDEEGIAISGDRNKILEIIQQKDQKKE